METDGKWSGFDVDFAVPLRAIFDDRQGAIRAVVRLDRFDAVKNKQIDVLSRNSSWTMGREGETASCSPV